MTNFSIIAVGVSVKDLKNKVKLHQKHGVIPDYDEESLQIIEVPSR
ncbi:hypothetical protein [uncultured Roseivirga sp.]|nr:hypothetical protein [uncultured Roseivirga sp.]